MPWATDLPICQLPHIQESWRRLRGLQMTMTRAQLEKERLSCMASQNQYALGLAGDMASVDREESG